MNDLSIRICTIRAAEGGARLLIEVVVEEQGEARRELLAILSARLERLPRVGPIDEEQYEVLKHEAAISDAIAAGLRALGANGSSRRHLCEKLCMRGIRREVAAIAGEELAEKGYLKEEEGALREAEKGLAKLWGDRRILADLSAKGYGGGALKYAAARLRSEDGAARCAQLISKRRMPIPTDAKEAQKLFAALTRYGYSAGEIRHAMEKLS